MDSPWYQLIDSRIVIIDLGNIIFRFLWSIININPHLKRPHVIRAIIMAINTQHRPEPFEAGHAYPFPEQGLRSKCRWKGACHYLPCHTHAFTFCITAERHHMTMNSSCAIFRRRNFRWLWCYLHVFTFEVTRAVALEPKESAGFGCWLCFSIPVNRFTNTEKRCSQKVRSLHLLTFYVTLNVTIERIIPQKTLRFSISWNRSSHVMFSWLRIRHFSKLLKIQNKCKSRITRDSELGALLPSGKYNSMIRGIDCGCCIESSLSFWEESMASNE